MWNSESASTLMSQKKYNYSDYHVSYPIWITISLRYLIRYCDGSQILISVVTTVWRLSRHCIFIVCCKILHLTHLCKTRLIYYLCQITVKMTYAESLLACLLDCSSNSRPLQNIYMICVIMQTTTISLDH